MSNGDYGYFGKGDTGYAQYMTAFNRNFGGSSGGGGGGGNHNNNGGGGGDGSGCGCLIAIAVVVVLIPQQQWRWRRGRQRMRLPDRYCSGRGADPDRLGWLNQSLQVKHRFSLWGFFESACRKQRSMVG